MSTGFDVSFNVLLLCVCRRVAPTTTAVVAVPVVVMLVLCSLSLLLLQLLWLALIHCIPNQLPNCTYHPPDHNLVPWGRYTPSRLRHQFRIWHRIWTCDTTVDAGSCLDPDIQLSPHRAESLWAEKRNAPRKGKKIYIYYWSDMQAKLRGGDWKD